MAASYVTYQAVGDSYLFPIPFPFLNPAYLKVTTPSGLKQADLDYIVEGVNVRFLKYKPVGTVTIRRETPIAGLVVPFADGALLNARVMSSASAQALQGLEETRDYIDAVRDDLVANLTPADSPIIASQLVGMQAGLDNVSASITTEAAIRASNDNAMAYVINQITAATGGAQALNQTGGSYSASWTAAQADYWTNLRAEVFTSGGTSIRAALASEASTRASADSAMATNITSLTTRVGAAESAITTEASTRASADSTMAADITSLKSRMGSAESAITTEQTTRASGDSANASSITSLTTRMNNAESSISTEASTRATQYGNLAAQYTLKLDVNGNIAGFDVASTGTVAGGTASKFKILADRFEVAVPGMGNYVPFSVGGFSANLLANTEFIGSMAPAVLGWNPPGCTLSLESGGNWVPASCRALLIYQGAQHGNIYNVGADTYPFGGYGDRATGIPVVPGKRYEFSAKLATHRADAMLVMDFFDVNDAKVGGAGTGWVGRRPGGQSLSGWGHVAAFGVAPAGAVYASLYWRKSDTDLDETSSYAWLTQPFFGEATLSQTVPSTYSPGFAKGAMSGIDKLTAANVATFMDNAVIGSAFIGDAQVGTLKIAGEAVTVPRVFASTAQVFLGVTGGAWNTVTVPPQAVEVASLYIDAGGATVVASFTGTVRFTDLVAVVLLAPSGAVIARSVAQNVSGTLAWGVLSLTGASTESGTYRVEGYGRTNGEMMDRGLTLIGAKR